MADPHLDQIRLQAELDAAAAVRGARYQYDQAYLQAMLDATKSALDRWRSAAELVQKSAAAIGTLYAGILGVAFSVSSRSLPIRGIVPAVFLGLAIAMSTVYVAYSTHGTGLLNRTPPEAPVERLRFRLNTFIEVVQEAVDRRVYWLRASVLALGAGVLFLPAPFVAFTSPPPLSLALYPFPSPVPVRNAADASIEAIVYKAQVDDIAAQRQRAEAAQNASGDLGLWVVVTVGALTLVLSLPLLPTLARRPAATEPPADDSNEPMPVVE